MIDRDWERVAEDGRPMWEEDPRLRASTHIVEGWQDEDTPSTRAFPPTTSRDRWEAWADQMDRDAAGCWG
jgi:hypothetical protein